MNWKNLAENTGLLLTGIVFGTILGWHLTIKTAKVMIEQQKETIHKAIDKESIKNEIRNEINVDKIKKSESIKIELDPINNQKPDNKIIHEADTSKKEVKRTFWDKVFGRKKDKKKKRAKE